MLSDLQIERYSRQIILPQVGGKGQEKLLRARVLVNGNGPVQSVALLYLAAAGVGTIGVLANASPPLFAPLTDNQEDALVTVLTRLNPDCTVVAHDTTNTVSFEQLVQQYDIILSPPDSLHDVCYMGHRPFLCAQISSGEAWLFGCRGYEPDSPCLHCLPAVAVENEEESITEAEAFFIGTLQTTEALKIVLGVDTASRGKLLRCQFPALQFTEQMVKKDPSCSLCGQGSR